VHPPDRIKKKKTQKGALQWKSRPPVFFWTQQSGDVSPTPSTCRQREFLICYFRGAPLTTGWWDPPLCHEPSVNINNLGCDPLLATEPRFLATMFPNSTPNPHKYFSLFSGDFCQGFD
jgi:hypothetical protein